MSPPSPFVYCTKRLLLSVLVPQNNKVSLLTSAYRLLFAETKNSEGQISALINIWSVCTFVMLVFLSPVTLGVGTYGAGSGGG